MLKNRFIWMFSRCASDTSEIIIMGTPQEEAARIWKDSQTLMESRFGSGPFNRWITQIRPLELSDDRIILGVDNDFCRMWIEENFTTSIREVLASYLGRDINISTLVSPQEIIESPSALKRQDSGEMRVGTRVYERRVKRFGLNPEYTFDRLVVGDHNHFAVSVAKNVARNMGKAKENPLYIYGPTGLGKTHLMHAIACDALRSNPNLSVRLSTSEGFLSGFIGALQERTASSFRDENRKVNLFLFDDTHFVGGKKGTQEELLHTFDELYNTGAQLVFTADRAPSDILNINPALSSRLGQGIVVEIKSPDKCARVDYIQRELQTGGLELPEKMVYFLADNLRRNMRSMGGAVNVLTAYRKHVGGNLESKEALEKLVGSFCTANSLNMNEVAKAVAEEFEVDLGHLKRKSRERGVSHPRLVAMYLGSLLNIGTDAEIATYFGMDRLSAAYARKQVPVISRQYSGFSDKIRRLEAKLGDIRG